MFMRQVAIYIDYTLHKNIKRLILTLARIHGEQHYSMEEHRRNVKMAPYAGEAWRLKILTEAINKNKIVKVVIEKFEGSGDGFL